MISLVKKLAIALHENKTLQGAWPEGAESAEQFRYGFNFNSDCIPHVWLSGEVFMTSDIECDDMPYVDEYEEGEIITKEEYESFISENPNFYQDIQSRKIEVEKEIEKLNKEVSALVSKMSELADEVCVGLNISLGPFGFLDTNSDWDASRC